MDNYFASVLEHTNFCLHKLEEFHDELSKGSLAENSFLAALHVLQTLIESGIGAAKQWLKHLKKPIHSSAYQNFEALSNLNLIKHAELSTWKSVIGLRNAIVHEYLEINRDIIYAVLNKKMYLTVSQFVAAAADSCQD